MQTKTKIHSGAWRFSSRLKETQFATLFIEVVTEKVGRLIFLYLTLLTPAESALTTLILIVPLMFVFVGIRIPVESLSRKCFTGGHTVHFLPEDTTSDLIILWYKSCHSFLS